MLSLYYFNIIITGFVCSFLQNLVIGMQGAFVLRNGLSKNKVFLSCFVCSLCDTFLITISVFFISTIISENQLIMKAFKYIGLCVLCYFSLNSFKNVFYAKDHFDIKNKIFHSNIKIISTGIMVSLFNPQALVDTTVVISTLCIKYTKIEKIYFFLGSISSSFVWFFSLGFLAKFLSKFFKKKIFWQILDFLIGIFMSILIIRLIRL